MNLPRLCLGAAVAALCLLPTARAQLQWSVFNETTSTAAPASTAASGVTVTVPAGKTATLAANNFVPIDLTGGGELYVTINFKASGGLSSISGGTRAVGFGMYNHASTATTFAGDNGYFTWLNGRATGSLIELRRRNGDGTSPSLLSQPNMTTTSWNSLGTGTTTQTTGALSDSNSYAIQIHLMGRSPGVSLGNTSSTTSGAGIWVSGPGLSQTAYTNPDNPPSTYVFNEIGFMFFNSTSSDVTLTINSVTSSNNALTPINAPAVTTPPAAISLNPGQAGALSVVATGTPPLAYQWTKGGIAIPGATAASYAIASASTTDAASYAVTVTNAYGTTTSSAAAVTVTTANIPATITSQPVGLTLNVGQSAVFSVTAFGSSPVTYQWQKNGTPIAGATSSTFSLASVGAGDAASYTVIVTSGTGTANAAIATSAAAALAVNTAPAITTQPVGVTTAAGQNVTFSVAATGSPAPTYQWLRNGVNLAGATSPTLTLTNVTLANTGVYTVSLVNSVGAVTSTGALLAIPSPMTATAFSPANGATGLNIDTPLSVTFDRPPSIGNIGRIRIFRASDNTVVDTLDLGVTPYTRSIGTQTVNYIFYPIIVTGNTAAIYPHAGVLAYGQTYYVQMEIGVINDSTSAAFTGVNDTTTWRFTTKAAGPAPGATALTVAADGSGDFTTVQGAIDFVPLNNTQRVVITVNKGVYTEMNYIGSQKPFITVQGQDRAGTIIQYADNGNFNTLTGNNRAMFSCDASDFTLQTITLHNLTPQGGSQAEAFRGNGLRIILNRVNLLSLQDTFLINGNNCSAFVTDSYIEGNTDFMWGSGVVYMQRTELKALPNGTATTGYYTQIRNGATQFGNVYVDCKLTAAPGVAGTVNYFLGRIDPTPGNFPYSQAIYLNCAMGPHISPVGWELDNATSSATVQDWEYKSTDLNGATLDVSRRLSSSRQLSDPEAVLWRNPAFVLGGWAPQVPPTIEAPGVAAVSAVAGSIARLTVVANGAPQPALQWFKNGVAIPGATDYTLVIPGVQPSDAGNYSVTATNSGGSVTSNAAALTVTRGAFAGTYFGTLGTGGTFALYVRDDGTGVFLGAPAGGSAVINRAITVDGSGRITAAASGAALTGTISSSGAVAGSAGTAAIAGARSSGSSSAFAGLFQTGASSGVAATASIIVGSGGQAYALVQNGATLDAGAGTVDSGGNVAVTTAGGVKVAITVAANAATGTFTPTGGSAVTVAGASDATASAQRLREFSARAQVTPTASAAVGFIITGGTDSVLVRAVGPGLADFAVTGALPNPQLNLYNGTSLVASNTGWTTAPNATEAAFAASQVGAFPLRTVNADSAIRIALAPGAYSAVMSSANGATSGIGLMEVYDLTVGAAGQRVVNLSTRGAVGNGSNALLIGFNVTGSQPKRLLIRGVGPGLAVFGVSGVAAKPVLSIYRGATLVAQNTGWATSADAPAIASAALEAATFALSSASADSAVIANLSNGLYTAQLTTADGAGGTGLIEIYELP
jgi:pectin methylesterase-like acyl-CoA thioesterase